MARLNPRYYTLPELAHAWSIKDTSLLLKAAAKGDLLLCVMANGWEVENYYYERVHHQLVKHSRGKELITGPVLIQRNDIERLRVNESEAKASIEITHLVPTILAEDVKYLTDSMVTDEMVIECADNRRCLIGYLDDSEDFRSDQQVAAMAGLTYDDSFRDKLEDEELKAEEGELDEEDEEEEVDDDRFWDALPSPRTKTRKIVRTAGPKELTEAEKLRGLCELANRHTVLISPKTIRVEDLRITAREKERYPKKHGPLGGFIESERDTLLKIIGLFISAFIREHGPKYGTIKEPNFNQLTQMLMDESKLYPNLDKRGLSKSTLNDKLPEADVENRSHTKDEYAADETYVKGKLSDANDRIPKNRTTDPQAE